MTPFRSFPVALICLLFALVPFAPGCSPASREKAEISEHKETYYFDAELGFTVEYPSDWKLRRGLGLEPESCTVRWQSPSVKGSPEPAARAKIVACPVSHWPGGFGEMRAEFLESFPELILTREEEISLPGGKGHLIEGNDPSLTHLIALLRSENKGYILDFATPNGDFETYRPLFEEMLESFRSLDGR